MQTVNKPTILVTGAGGFIGKAVVAALLKNGYRVIAMVRPQAIAALPAGNSNLTILRADIRDYNSFAKQVKPCSAIVHLAANKYNPKLAPAVNLTGAENLVRLVKEKKLHGNRLINISSQSTKIRRKGVYGTTKAQSDIILEQDFIAWTTIKPSLVYGNETGSLFNTIAHYTKTLPFVPVIGNGQWQLYPIRVDDVAQAIVAALENTATIHNVYDLGSKEPVTFDELIQTIQQTIGIQKPIVHIPMWLGLAATWLASKVLPSLPISTDNILGSNQPTYCNPLPAMKDLHIRPVPLLQGAKSYLRQQPKTGQRIAMIGLGKMGILHATVLSAISKSAIVALIDKDQSLAVTAQSMGITAPTYTSLPEAIAAQPIDAAVICTPNFTHADIMKVCVQHHLPFFIEKPVVTKSTDLAAIIATMPPVLLKKSAAGYFWIYRREVVYTKRLLDQHALGTIQSYTVTLKHSEVFGPKKGWPFIKKLSGGGVLMNPGPHAISLIHYFFGRPTVTDASVRYLYGNDVEDEAHVKFQHPGITGQLNASWSVQGYPILTIEYAITGSSGSITFANNVLTIARGKAKQVIPYTQLPAPTDLYDLNPKAGGEGYYQEDFAFYQGLVSAQPMRNSLQFALAVETTIDQIYTKAQYT